MRKKIRSIHIIFFVMLFLVGSFIDILTIHAEAGSRTGSIQIIYKGRNSPDKEVTLSGAKFSIFPIQYMKNDELIWEDGFKDDVIELKEIFNFKQTGITETGEVDGAFDLKKRIPSVYKKIKSKGINDIEDIFNFKK